MNQLPSSQFPVDRRPEEQQAGEIQLGQMQAGELDGILLEETLEPSSGFAALVMEAIEAQAEDAAAPAPIPFPWKYALPGVAGFLVALILVVQLVSAALRPGSAPGLDGIRASLAAQPAAQPFVENAGPILLALAVALVCTLLTRRLTLGRSAR